MFKNITPAQLTLIKWAAMGLGAYWVYNKVTTLGSAAIDKAGEIASTSLNPMHKDNLINQAAENIVGADNLSAGGTLIFDWLDSAAEFVGVENGINGIPGTTADAEKRFKTTGPESLRNKAPFLVGPEVELQAKVREAGATQTAKFGANANG